MIQMTQLQVAFPDLPEPVLDIPHLYIAEGERVAIVGPSGSGKTTLINVMTGLDGRASGSVQWDQQELSTLSEAGRDRWRARHVGLIMQDFHLFPGLSALENVLLPARFHHWRLPRALKTRAAELLERVGLETGERTVERLSRGEKQRVAVARALLGEPDMIVADEPTASLDRHNGQQIAELLIALARDTHTTLIAVTHDRQLSDGMARCIRLEQGRIVLDEKNQEQTA
ncbi:ABC transporter ATP-binding protein [Lonsdalea quercina]|uniref:ABC transporter ATP-binding protein n=1 Tax=Lonsdalea quercina TaxID=71657 RepID=UPI003974F511